MRAALTLHKTDISKRSGVLMTLLHTRNFKHLAAAFLALTLILAETHAAFAQSTRYWKRSVEAGKQIEFQWSNYDEATCRDNGYARLKINKKPTLGRFRSVRKKVTQRSGACKGKRFSVLYVYYVAGRKKGKDRPAYTIQGGSSTKINLNITVN